MKILFIIFSLMTATSHASEIYSCLGQNTTEWIIQIDDQHQKLILRQRGGENLDLVSEGETNTEYRGLVTTSTLKEWESFEGFTKIFSNAVVKKSWVYIRKSSFGTPNIFPLQMAINYQEPKIRQFHSSEIMYCIPRQNSNSDEKFFQEKFRDGLFNSNIQFVQEALNAGVNPNLNIGKKIGSTTEMMRAISWAIRGNDPAIVDLLLSHPLINLDILIGHYGATALHTAVAYMNEHAIDQILANKNEYQRERLLTIAGHQQILQIATTAIGLAAYIRETDPVQIEKRLSVLEKILSYANRDAINISYSYDISNYQPTDGHPLTMAARAYGGSKESTKMLLAAGADFFATVTGTPYSRLVALDTALMHANIESAELLLPYLYDSNRINGYEEGLLVTAARACYDIDNPNLRGGNRTIVIKKLFDLILSRPNVEINKVQSTHTTPLDEIERRCDEDIVTYLRSKGAKTWSELNQP